MKFEVKPKNSDVITEEILIVNGREVGWIKTSAEDSAYKFHVGIQFSNSSYRNLVQGHGGTVAMSIRNAFDDALKDIAFLKCAIETLDAEMMAE